MTSGYASNKYKIKGIQQQPYVLKKILIFLRSRNYIVEAEPATFEQDTRAKIDYFLKFDESTKFLGKTEIAIDVKYARSYTVISDGQKNVLETSKAAYIVLNHPINENNLLWISVSKLKECFKEYPPYLIESFEEGNRSKFVWIFDYVRKYQNFFGKAAMEVTVPYVI